MKGNIIKTVKALKAAVLLFALLCAFAVSASATESGDTLAETSTAPAYDFTATYGFDPLVAWDGAEAQDYVKGPTPPTAYLKAGDNYVVAENGYKFRDYVFAGWKCGGTVYKPGEIIYNVNSNLVFKATWKRPASPGMSVVGFISYANGSNITTQSVTVGTTVALKEGYWQDNHGRIFTGGSSFLMSFSAVDFTQAVSGNSTVSVKYDGNGVTTGIQSSFSVLTGGSFIVDDCFANREGYVFSGWSDGKGRVYLVGDTCIASSDTVLTAIWRESAKPAPDYCTVMVNVGKGGTASPAGKSTIERGESFTFSVAAEDGYKLVSVTCNGAELGTVGEYTLLVKDNMTFEVGFEELPKPPAEESSEEISTEEVSAEESTEVSTETNTSADNKPQDTKDGDSGKGLLIAIAIVICIGGIAIAAWFVSKSNNKKRKRRR